MLHSFFSLIEITIAFLKTKTSPKRMIQVKFLSPQRMIFGIYSQNWKQADKKGYYFKKAHQLIL
jgi:hypothetical protein